MAHVRKGWVDYSNALTCAKGNRSVDLNAATRVPAMQGVWSVLKESGLAGSGPAAGRRLVSMQSAMNVGKQRLRGRRDRHGLSL